MLMIAIYIVARIKGLPAEPWRGFGEIVAGGKEAGWGLFLIIIIIGGIYGGVFTPTEAAAVAAIYSFFIAVFIYRDMGPMAGITWVNETDSRRARAGFSGLVYALAFYFVWMILSFFATSGSETVTFAGRSNLGLAISLFILVAYTAWRGEKGSCRRAGGADGRLAYLGPQPVADGPEFRPRLLQRRHAQGDGRFASKTTIMLMFIIVNALLFAHVLTSERFPTPSPT
jgi:C4-dicarboxylate transporter DctM subunit